MSLRRAAWPTAAASLVAAATMTAAQAWDVLPPGQAGGVGLTRSSTDQIALYEGLTRLRENVTAADLRRYFKPETLGLAPGDRAVRVERPRAGVTVTRDRWGVPHVKGRTARSPGARPSVSGLKYRRRSAAVTFSRRRVSPS